MGRCGFLESLLLALGVALSNCAPQAIVTSSQAPIPAIAPGTARVWLLREWYAPSGRTYVYPATPLAEMPRFLLFAILVLAACTEASISRIDSRTFAIESPGIPGGSEAPNRRLAERACPGGYRVMDKMVHQGTPDRARDEPGIFTNWTIRCL